MGGLVKFKVHLPDGPWVVLKGELVSEDYPIGFGLRFTGLTDGDRRLLRKWLSLTVVILAGCRSQPRAIR